MCEPPRCKGEAWYDIPAEIGYLFCEHVICPVGRLSLNVQHIKTIDAEIFLTTFCARACPLICHVFYFLRNLFLRNSYLRNREENL